VKLNLAKLNHVLIPTTKAERDRFRRGPLGRIVRPLGAFYATLTEEGRILFTLSFLVGGFGVDVSATVVHLLWAALVALVLGSLVVHRAYRIDPFRIEVAAARRITVGEEMTFTVLLHNDGDRDRHAVRVLGPFLPWDGRWVGEVPRVARVPAGSSVRAEVRARFVERGEHHLDAFHAAALVPMGLALGPGVASAGVRFLVVPRIASVVRLALPLGRRHQPGGVALASKTGESMDLLGVRPYRPGDPVRHLHARSWARVGAPVVREYQEEYFSRVGVLVETAGTDADTAEAILSLAAGVVAHLSRGEALIDLLVVGGEVHDLTLGRNLGFLDQALDLLACVQVGAKAPADVRGRRRREKPEPEAPLPDALLGRLAPHLGRLSCLVVVTARWDEGALAERIRGAGVGCRTLLVQGGGRLEGAPGPEVVVVDAAAIARGEALSL